MRKKIMFLKKEPVLFISIVLAAGSAFVVAPDRKYFSYIDFRTLGILFSLMAIVAGLTETGLFDQMAEKLLNRAKSMTGIVMLLVFLCFFLSMLVTNDVSLLTFVPLTITVLNKMEKEIREKWMLKIIVMQTIAANLGSMLTPVGNPQNLYLYGKSEMGILAFLKLMFPYTLLSMLLLVIWIVIEGRRKRNLRMENGNVSEEFGNVQSNPMEKGKLAVYLGLFAVSLLTVAHLLPVWLLFGMVLVYLTVKNQKILKKVDYCLLGTFAALFIFIGNLGRIPAFAKFLSMAIEKREMITAVLASQVMSNVPAAILLSGFTENYKALIVGTNLGGLGTLIASMASLISFKYAAKECGEKKGAYVAEFTAANLVFLVILLLPAVLMCAGQ